MDLNFLGNLLLGFAVGGYGTLVGVGGGFLLVPIFLLFYHLPHQVAVGTSLAIVTANAFSGTIGYMRKKKIDYRAGISFSLATIPGAIFGSMLTEVFSGDSFNRIFGSLLLVVALYLFFRKAAPETEKVEPYSMPLGLGISAAVGVVSSWLGIGGGIIHVPAMALILKFPMHVAVATSHFVLFWSALVGSTTHGLHGGIDWSIALPMGLGALAGAQLGVKLAPRFRGPILLRLLAVAMLGLGVRLIFS